LPGSHPGGDYQEQPAFLGNPADLFDHFFGLPAFESVAAKSDKIRADAPKGGLA
jgi:hypothetical protein